MELFSTIKRNLFNAFREIFIYHHSSLEFRAKLFALVIAVNGEGDEKIFNCVRQAGMAIYNDEDRAEALVLTTQEIIAKVHDDNGLNEDLLVQDIIKDMREVPRYRNKVNTKQLGKILEFTADEDIRSYQENILEFLDSAKEQN